MYHYSGCTPCFSFFPPHIENLPTGRLVQLSDGRALHAITQRERKESPFRKYSINSPLSARYYMGDGKFLAKRHAVKNGVSRCPKRSIRHFENFSSCPAVRNEATGTMKKNFLYICFSLIN